MPRSSRSEQFDPAVLDLAPITTEKGLIRWTSCARNAETKIAIQPAAASAATNVYRR